MTVPDPMSCPNPSEDSAGFGDWQRGAHGEFTIGGSPLSRVVDAVGGTPCYLYDRERISARAMRLRGALSPDIHLHYAIKANPMPALVGYLASRVDGLDVASAGELRLALDTGMSAEHISFAGPGKSPAELEQAHAAGVLVNVESFREVRHLAALTRRKGYPARVAIRVNLPFELRASGMKMTGGARQFGIDADQVEDIIALVEAEGLVLEGFHLFAGSQNLNADAIIEAQARSYDCVLEWTRSVRGRIRSINLGGGFGIPYTRSDIPLDAAPILDHLNTLAGRSTRDYAQARLVIELGRYLVGEAGIYVCRVVERKVSRGKTFLITDGGMHHHLAASGNFGQVVRKNYPAAINRGSSDIEVVDIVGPLCTPLDTLGRDVRLDRAEEDDLIIIFQSGAYGRSASPRGFLGHPDVAEALV